MTTVTDYKILKNYSDELEEDIRDYLKSGWQLYGFPYWNDKYHCQAIIKTVDDSKVESVAVKDNKPRYNMEYKIFVTGCDADINIIKAIKLLRERFPVLGLREATAMFKGLKPVYWSTNKTDVENIVKELNSSGINSRIEENEYEY